MTRGRLGESGGFGIRLGGTSIDRAGGLLRLRSVAADLVGSDLVFRILDTGSHWRLVVDAFPRGTREEDRYTRFSPKEVELLDVAIARSVAIREDQRDLLEGDLLALEPLLRAEVARQERERLPESEKRLLDGNR